METKSYICLDWKMRSGNSSCRVCVCVCVCRIELRPCSIGYFRGRCIETVKEAPVRENFLQWKNQANDSDNEIDFFGICPRFCGTIK